MTTKNKTTTKKKSAQPKKARAASRSLAADGGLAAAVFDSARDGGATVSTDAKITLVGVQGIENTDQDFKDKVMQIADSVKVNPNYLMAVMSFETGGSFSPKIKSLSGSGATGLIQFMPPTARGLGTTIQALEQMSALEQLDYVAKHFAPFKNRLKTLEDAYMAVLYPVAVGKGADHVLFKKGTAHYAQNRGLDINGSGEITVGEAAAKVRARLGTASVGTGEILRRGVTSPEVGKLQDEMIDLGYLKPEQKASGANRFGPLTEGAVKNFQRDNHIQETGVYDEATQEAVRQLNEVVKRGSTGDVVFGLQMRLVQLGYLTLAQVSIGGKNFGPLTENALKIFQLQHGVQASGVLTDETYRALLASAPTPTPAIPTGNGTSIDQVLPASGTGFTTYRREQGGADQYGRASTIRAIMEISEAWATRRASPRLQFGDISRRNGGPFAPHAAHRRGLEVDARPVTNNNLEEASNINAMNYSHQLTKEFVQIVREKFPAAIVFFNDQRLINLGLTRPLAGHSDHLHIRFPG